MHLWKIKPTLTSVSIVLQTYHNATESKASKATKQYWIG